MADQMHDWTDSQIEELQRRFDAAYSQAAKDMREKLDDYLKSYSDENARWKSAVGSGIATDDEYRAWLRGQSVRRDYLTDMCDTLARDATRTNQLALDMVRNEIPRIYAENANYAAFEVESALGADTHSFDLVDQSTVRQLMGLDDDGQVIKEVTLDRDEVSPPLRTLRKLGIDEAKDVRWNRQKFNAALTQSILQGESIPNTAKRMSRVLNMGKSMAVRAARTAMTSAENAGRVDSYRRAKSLGIDLEQEWMATLDERTRHSHRELDGQHVPVGEKFRVPSSGHELEFPADPKADPSEVWNCRCTLVAWFPDIEQEDNKRWDRLPKGMTYDEWKGAKERGDNHLSMSWTSMDSPIWSQLGSIDSEAVAAKVNEILGGSHGKAAQLWSKMEPSLTMADPTYTKGAYFAPRDGVHMNVSRSLDNTGNRGTLSTWFHEFGHNMDNASARSDPRFLGSFSSTRDSNAFGATLKSEVDAYIDRRKKEMSAEYKELVKGRDLRSLMERGFIENGPWARSIVEEYERALSDDNWATANVTPYWGSFSDDRKRELMWSRASDRLGIKSTLPVQTVRDAVGKEITGGGKDVQLALGDIFEGATRGKCQDTYGHGKSYWDSGNELLAEEAFAEFFSAECIYAERPEILDTMIERLPESYKVYQQIVDWMLDA